MKLALAVSVVAGLAAAQDRGSSPAAGDGQREGHPPPPQAYEDCRGHRAGDVVQHATREGAVAATCAESPSGLVARPNEPRGSAGPTQGGAAAHEPRDESPGHATGAEAGGGGTRGPAERGRTAGEAAPRYSLEQAVSDRAQLDTIAFDCLAFLTGGFADDTFLPPGKVSDYFGFQYMRDVDAREGGHNTSFLTRIANNTLSVLDDAQRAQLLALAKQQEADIRRFAEMRFPLIAAFRRNLEGRAGGRSGLDRQAVMKHSADLYALDGRLSYERARVMGRVLRGLSGSQKAALSRLKFGDSGTWPDAPEALDRRGLSHETHVAVMTYASEMFSWYAGSLEADTYFCPERHGMYFGGFGMKTAPAMGKRDYSISTTLTGNSGESLLAALDDSQRRPITALVDLQRADLGEIVRVRRAIATELRRFQTGDSADEARVIALSRRYGELDGEMSYLYATAFAKVGQSLSASQRQSLASLRSPASSGPRGPFLYSTPIAMPSLDGVDAFFGAGR